MKIYLKTDAKSSTIICMGDFGENVDILSGVIFDHPHPTIVHTERSDKVADNINIFDAAKYLTSLFFETKNKYTCNRLKVEKLLAIADLVAIKNKDKLFREYPIFINSCGVGYCVLSAHPESFPMDNIITGTNDAQDSLLPESPQTISITSLNSDAPIPDTYKVEDVFNENIKKLLKDVFLNFGMYQAKAIGGTMDLFKENIQSQESDEKYNKRFIDEEKVRTFFAKPLESSLSSNAIVKFIFEYTYYGQ